MLCGCSSQVAMLDVFATIPDNSFKTLTPFKNSQRFIDDSINEWRRCLEAVIKNSDISC